MYIKILSISSLNLGGGAENNPVRSSVSDQCYFYVKYDKNASTSISVLRGGAKGALPPPPPNID